MSDVATFWQVLGLSIERTSADEAVLRMDVPEALLSPWGQVHGGVLATLIDTGMAVAVAHRVDSEDRIATHNLNVSYVAFADDRVLRCRARVLSLRRTVAIAEAEVVTAGGTLVAKAVATFGLRRRRA
jgi:acyl-CoA thioesterase